MFELPNAKRVRRDELYGSSSDGGDGQGEDGVEEAEERARLNARLSSMLGLDFSAPEPAPAPDAHGDADDADGQAAGADPHEEEFEFRLFSTAAGSSSAPAKVVLSASDDEDGPRGEGGFVQPVRPWRYYLAGEATPQQQERYRWAAVTAEDIAAGASKRAWGLERPWRVVKISLSPGKATAKSAGLAAGATAAIQGVEDGQKKKRPGKKRRIAVRIKARAEKEKREAEKARKEAEAKQRISKEEHLVEKKKRLNREKKLKRRAKDKEKKLAAGQTVPASEAPSSPPPE